MTDVIKRRGQQRQNTEVADRWLPDRRRQKFDDADLGATKKQVRFAAEHHDDADRRKNGDEATAEEQPLDEGFSGSEIAASNVSLLSARSRPTVIALALYAIVPCSFISTFLKASGSSGSFPLLARPGCSSTCVLHMIGDSHLRVESSHRCGQYRDKKPCFSSPHHDLRIVCGLRRY